MKGVVVIKGVMVVEGAGGSVGGSCLVGRAVERVRGELLGGNDGSTFTGSSGRVGSSLTLMEGGLMSMATSAVVCSTVSILSSRRAFFFSLMTENMNTILSSCTTSHSLTTHPGSGSLAGVSGDPCVGSGPARQGVWSQLQKRGWVVFSQ